MEKMERIKEFILGQINSLDNLIHKEVDLQQKLNLTTKRISYSNILKSYFDYTGQLYKSYFYQANTYHQLQCYDQAIHNAKIAQKAVLHDQNQSKQIKLESVQILIIECLVKKQKFTQAQQILEKITVKHLLENYYRIYNKISSKLKDQDKCQTMLAKLEQQIINKYSKSSVEYGLFLIERGRTYAIFDEKVKSVNQMGQGMEILVQQKYNNVKDIYFIYKQMANTNKSLNNIEAQYTNLICAQAMLRQIPNNSKEMLQILHRITKNFEERELYEKALIELQKIQGLQRQVYGDSSINLGKTLEKISTILLKLGKKNQAKYYERECQRLLGNSNQKRKNILSKSKKVK